MRSAVLGLATIGQAPRIDIVPGMVEHLPRGTQVLQAGALDGLDADTLAAMRPQPGEYVLTSRLADGSSVTVGRSHVIPLLQAAVTRLEEQGASVLAILCTGTFPDLASRALLIEPERLFHAACAGVVGVGRKRLGSLIPLPAQIPQAEARWRQVGVDALVVAASPYGSIDAIAAAAGELGRAGVAAIALDCFGFTEEMRQVVRQAAGRPVIMANTYLARVMAELLS
jgi:protein AroM